MRPDPEKSTSRCAVPDDWAAGQGDSAQCSGCWEPSQLMQTAWSAISSQEDFDNPWCNFPQAEIPQEAWQNYSGADDASFSLAEWTEQTDWQTPLWEPEVRLLDGRFYSHTNTRPEGHAPTANAPANLPLRSCHTLG